MGGQGKIYHLHSIVQGDSLPALKLCVYSYFCCQTYLGGGYVDVPVSDLEFLVGVLPAGMPLSCG
jgi:hypothetical protein